MEELWKDIVEYEELYQVSNFGRIRSLERTVRNGRNNLPGGIMSPGIDAKGYLRIGLSKDNKRKTFKIHRLVASAFIENVDILPEVNHKDSDKKNNFSDNLEWVTGQQNIDHFYAEGDFESRNKKLRNEKNPNSKLTQKDVNLIKKLRNEYVIKIKTLSDLFGVSVSQIKRIVYGQQWNKETI